MDEINPPNISMFYALDPMQMWFRVKEKGGKKFR